MELIEKIKAMLDYPELHEDLPEYNIRELFNEAPMSSNIDNL